MLFGKRRLPLLILLALILNLLMFPVLWIWREDGRCQQYAAWAGAVIYSSGASGPDASWGAISVTDPCMSSSSRPTVVYEVTRGSCTDAVRTVQDRLQSANKLPLQRRTLGKCYLGETGEWRFEIWDATVEVS